MRFSLLFIAAFSFFLFGCSDRGELAQPSENTPAKALIESYAKKSDSLIKSIRSGGEVVRESRELLSIGNTLAIKFMGENPKCADYLNKSLEVNKLLKTISLDRIEKDFHKDGVLPNAPEECYHIKDLVVHPATVVVLSRGARTKAALQQMEAEIQEVKAHLTVVEASFSDAL